MELIAFGGDARTQGLLRAARQAGMNCRQVKKEEELETVGEFVDVIVLPWPRSFVSGKLAGTEIAKEELLSRLPACGALLCGGVEQEEIGDARLIVDPALDEEFTVYNAKLTAEAAVSALLEGSAGALMGKTCMITGFGRIAIALAQRLIAMETFTIVCARNEGQMQLAHRMGAHPVPLRELASACAQADIVLNTVPARVFGAAALAAMKPGTRMIELASTPYGADPEQAASMGVSMEIMGGLPGKYAPIQAGEALFFALWRAMRQEEKEK